MVAMTNRVLRNIPSVNELLDSPPLRRLLSRVSHNVVVSGARDFLDNLRRDVQSAAAEIKLPTAGELAERIADDYGARELLHFGARPENRVDPPRVVGIPNDR